MTRARSRSRLTRLRKRFSLYGHPHAWPRPFVTYVNEGPDFHFICVGITAPYGDSLVSFEVNLGEAK